MKTKNCPLDLAAQRVKLGPRDKSSFRGMCRQKPNGCKLEKMGDEEVEMVPTDNSEVLLESEAERSGGTWRGM